MRYLLTSLLCFCIVHYTISAELAMEAMSDSGPISDSSKELSISGSDDLTLPKGLEDVNAPKLNEPIFQKSSKDANSKKVELQTINSLISQLQDISEGMKEDRNSYLDRAGYSSKAIRHFSSRFKILKRINRQIHILNQMTFSESTNVKTPTENAKLLSKLIHSKKSRFLSNIPTIFQSKLTNAEGKAAVRKFGDSIVEELKKVIKCIGFSFSKPYDRDYYATRTPWFILFQRSAFKVIDFLFKNKFANGESFRSIFQDNEVIANTVYYSYHRFNDDIHHSILEAGSPYFTSHWYWLMLHNSFEVLGPEQKKTIDASLMIIRLSLKVEEAPQHYRTSEKWRSFSDSFGLDKFLLEFEVIKKSFPNQDVEEFDEHARKIIDLLLTPYQPSHGTPDSSSHEKFHSPSHEVLGSLSHEVVHTPSEEVAQKKVDNEMELGSALTDALDFVEEHVSQGIIKKKLAPFTERDQFEKLYVLIRRMLRIEDLKAQADTYFYKLSNRLETLESAHHKDKFDDFVNQIDSLAKAFTSSWHILELKAEYTYTFLWFTFNQKFSKIVPNLDNWLEELNHKSKNFFLREEYDS